MTLRDIVLNQISHRETDFVPYTLTFEQPVRDKLNQHFGSTDWEKRIVPAVYTAKGCFDTWDTMTGLDPLAPNKVRDAYGSQWTMAPDIFHLDQPALKGMDPDQYQWPVLGDFLTPEKEQELVRSCEAQPDKFTILPAGAGHFELSWRLMGLEDALMAVLAEPDMYEHVLENLDRLLHQFIDVLVKLPGDAIMLADDWCDQRSCMMGPDRWRRLIKPRLAGLYDKIHAHGKFVINHACGNVAPLIPDLIEIGLDVLESVQPEAADMNPYALKERYGDKLTFWGGLGCQHMVTFASPQELQQEIRKLRTHMSRGGGYILAPAKTLNQTVSLANALTILDTFTEENYKLGLPPVVLSIQVRNFGLRIPC